MNLDPDICYRAIASRDARFDGRLFVGVTSTGIYCRPICPARTPRREHVRFFSSAAAAQEAGFRSCLRCRPECSPELATWRGTSNTVSRGLALIADGALDGGADVDALAERLGVGERHLRRLFRQHLGASPVTIAQTRRVLFAQRLIAQTELPFAEVALAAGFGSVRRFNACFRALYGRPPRELRRERRQASATRPSGEGAVEIALPYAPPYDWHAIRDFLAARAIPGVEQVQDDTYHRSIALDGVHGTVSVRHDAARAQLVARIAFARVDALLDIVARLRRVFDLAADPVAIGTQLAEDPVLAPLVAARPGLRVPGAWDGFELGVRAVLGQQVSVEAARRLAARLVAAYGERVASDDVALTQVFPTPQVLAAIDPDRLAGTLRMPRARAVAIVSLAQAAADDPRLLRPGHTLDEALERLRRLRGIGEWTAQYIAMRALREPDAFPAADIGLMRALADARTGVRPTAAQLLARAEHWRPWRAYAALHLWAHDADAQARRDVADALASAA